MVRDIKEYSYDVVEGKTHSLKWGDNFTLMCESKDQFPYAEKCLAYLDTLSKEMEERLCKYLLRYYKDYEKYFDDDELAQLGTIDMTTIIDHICIDTLIIGNECRQDRIEFHIEGSCDWEPEHGLEITISDNKILYVGSYEDYGPNTDRLQYALDNYGYYDPTSEDIHMNYVDKE